jgi:hypothetical protein
LLVNEPKKTSARNTGRVSRLKPTNIKVNKQLSVQVNISIMDDEAAGAGPL